jgi:LysR family transcriptional regulator, glycine cleavage system transcriptional activator
VGNRHVSVAEGLHDRAPVSGSRKAYSLDEAALYRALKENRIWAAASERLRARLLMSSFRTLPPLNALAAFEAVARHRSFTKAAGELFLTHSAVSQRVTQLEKHLNVQLLARSRRTVELTAAGARYLESVRDALTTLARAADEFSAAQPKQLRLSVVPVLANNWLIYRLRSFRRLHPNVDLDIQSSTAMANVKTGEVDIAIRWGRGDWPGVEKMKLFPDEVFPVCSKLYLKGLGALQSPADLQRGVLLRHSFQRWKPWFEQAGLDWPEPTQGPIFNDSSLMLQAAADGHGIALGRRMLTQDLLEQGALVRLFDISAFVEEAFYVVFAKESLQRPEVAAFVGWIKSAAEEEFPGASSPKME